MTQEDRQLIKGRMRADWWVLCGGCGVDEWLDNYEARQVGGLVALAKAKNWKYTKTRGWLCSDCEALTRGAGALDAADEQRERGAR